MPVALSAYVVACVRMTLCETNKRGSSVYGKRAQRSALGALRKFCWSGILQGCTTHGPARTTGQANRLLTVPTRVCCAEIRYSIPPSHRHDKIRRRQRAPDNLGGLSLGHQFVSGSVWECLQVLLFLRVLFTCCPLTLGLHIGRVQMVVSRPGQLDLDYRSVVLYVECIMVSP